jgi:hypothetical protein
MGMSQEMADRRAMLDHNMNLLVKSMKESGLADPVGIVADTRDTMGRRLFKSALIATGKTEREADEQIRAMSEEMAKKKQFLTGILVVDWKRAEAILPLTSPTTSENLRNMKPQFQTGTGIYLIVAVGSGGNTYGVVEIDDMPQPLPPIEDGQHRVTGIYFPKR